MCARSRDISFESIFPVLTSSLLTILGAQATWSWGGPPTSHSSQSSSATRSNISTVAKLTFATNATCNPYLSAAGHHIDSEHPDVTSQFSVQSAILEKDATTRGGY
jgi:hypothetical protein